MLLEDDISTAVVPHTSDEWVPPGWGTEEQIAAEAKAFNTWTRTMRTQ